MDGVIRGEHNRKTWLSYLGVQVKKGKVADALKSVTGELYRSKYNDSYMHGTSATALVGIEATNGRLQVSTINIRESSDFGDGFYCFKGKLEYALSFAIDRCCPLFEKGSFTKHNPAVILFPNPCQFNKRDQKKVFYDIVIKGMYNDKQLRTEVLHRTEDYAQQFKESEKEWKHEGIKVRRWKEFVKLARSFGEVPAKNQIFIGWLHDCETIALTDRCSPPKIDKDKWIQHCYTDPPRDLREDQLFIELNVD